MAKAALEGVNAPKVIASGFFSSDTFEFSNLVGCTAVNEFESTVQGAITLTKRVPPAKRFIIITPEAASGGGASRFSWFVSRSDNDNLYRVMVTDNGVATSNFSYHWIVLELP